VKSERVGAIDWVLFLEIFLQVLQECMANRSRKTVLRRLRRPRSFLVRAVATRAGQQAGLTGDELTETVAATRTLLGEQAKKDLEGLLDLAAASRADD
jgi:hypothetical protein